MFDEKESGNLEIHVMVNVGANWICQRRDRVMNPSSDKAPKGPQNPCQVRKTTNNVAQQTLRVASGAQQQCQKKNSRVQFGSKLEGHKQTEGPKQVQ